jgi:hypothetical protein
VVVELRTGVVNETPVPILVEVGEEYQVNTVPGGSVP